MIARSLFPATTHKDVLRCLEYRGRAKTIEEMDASVLAEARRRSSPTSPTGTSDGRRSVQSKADMIASVGWE